jgi:hypothetical protein
MPDESPWARPGTDTVPGDDAATASEGMPGGPEEETPPPADTAGPPPTAPHHRDSSGSAAIAILGMMLLVLSGLVVALVVYVTGDNGERYPTGLANDEYDLAAMALRQRDVPRGMELAGKIEFNNDEWAAILDSVDPESRIPQLRAQQRVRNHISVFAWPDGGTAHLAQTLNLLAQSTLYETEAAAREAIVGAALCGLRLPETSPIEDFVVPRIGDESVGFFVISNDPDIGISIETVVCFRTGRIVHGIVQSALDGAHDIALTVRLAQKMLTQVERTFAGNPDPVDPDPNAG